MIVFDVYFIHTILIIKDKTAETAINSGGPLDDLVLNLIIIDKTIPGITESQANSLSSSSDPFKIKNAQTIVSGSTAALFLSHYSSRQIGMV